MESKKENKKKRVLFNFPGTGGGSKFNPDIKWEKEYTQIGLADPAGGLETTPGVYAKQIDPKERTKDGLKHMVQGVLEVQPQKIAEGIAMSVSEDKARFLGLILGTGDITNNERVLDELDKLEKNGELPEEVVLEGHSRGAINAIMAANEIYKKYGDKVKVHLLLSDPVPGPFHEEEWKKRVIPPNVASFSAIYTTDDHMGPFFVPHSLDKLVFTNKQTIISSYALNKLPHPSCHFGNFPEIRNKILAGIAGKNNKIIREIKNRTSSGNEIVFSNVDEMQKSKNKNFWRRNCHFYGETNLDDYKGAPNLVMALKDVRRWFNGAEDLMSDDAPYKDPKSNSGTKDISYSEVTLGEKATPREREAALYGAYRNKFKYTMTTDQIIASLLVLPTLGFSANLYQAKQIHDSTYRALYFIAGVLTLNTLPIVHKVAVDVGLLVANVLIKPAISAIGGFWERLRIGKTGPKHEDNVPKEKNVGQENKKVQKKEREEVADDVREERNRMMRGMKW